MSRPQHSQSKGAAEARDYLRTASDWPADFEEQIARVRTFVGKKLL